MTLPTDMFSRPISTVDQVMRDSKRPRILPPQQGFPPEPDSFMLGGPGMPTEDLGQIGPQTAPTGPAQLPLPAAPMPPAPPLEGEIMPPGSQMQPASAQQPVDGRAMLLDTAKALLQKGSPAQRVQGLQMLFEAQQPTPAEKEEADRERLRAAVDGADADDAAKRRAMLGIDLGAKPDDVLEALGFDATGQKAAKEKKEGVVKFMQELGNTQYTNSVLRKSADLATEIIDTSLLPATGTVGGYTEWFKGAPANRLESALAPIKAIIGFDRLQQMRNESQTGGALGQVAVQELYFLQSTAGSLDITQDGEVLKANIADVIKGKELLTQMRQLVPALEAGDPKAIQAYMELSKQLGEVGADASYRTSNFGGQPQPKPGEPAPGAPAAVPKPSLPTSEIMRRAQQAIAEGAPEAKVLEQLRSWGVDMGAP